MSTVRIIILLVSLCGVMPACFMGAKLLVRPIFQPNSYAVELRTVYTVGEESVSDRHIAGTWTELGSPMWGLLTVLSALMFTVSVWHLFPVKRERSVENTVSITDIGQYFETYLIPGSTDCPLTISPKDGRYAIQFPEMKELDNILWSIASLIRKYQNCDDMIIEVRET